MIARQAEMHRRAPADRAVDADEAVGLAGEAVELAQPQAGALADRLGGEEGFEDAGQHVRRHAAPAVAHGHRHVIAGRHPGIVDEVGRGEAGVGGLHRHGAAAGHGVAGVDDQVQQGAFDLVHVGTDRPQRLLQPALQPDRLADRPAQQIPQPHHQRVQVGALRLQRLAPGEGQQAPGQGGGTIHRGARGDGEGHDVGAAGFQPLFDQLQAAADRLQQVVEVVGHPAGQLADRLHLLRLGQGLARLVQRLLGLAALGDVAGDLGESAQDPGLVADGVDDDAGPEAGAVLAHAPALRLEPALVQGGGERPLRHSGGAVLVRVEAGEMPADDLAGAVALHPRRARIPTADAAGGVEHEDRVVDHALDQQAELFLAAPQRLLGHPAFGDVAGDLGEAHQRAGLVADGADHHAGPEAGAVLAHAPALRLEAALVQGGGERPLRHPGGAVLIRVEGGEMPADDLLGPVALEARGSGIPAADDPVRVEQIDRVIGDTVDQELEPPFAGDGLPGGRGVFNLHNNDFPEHGRERKQSSR